MNKKLIFLTLFIILGLLALVLWQELTINDGKLHLVFCDVGQGDAIFIRTPQKRDILIDGGPDRRVLDCLSQHMPFWDKTIDVVILSHPHQDHFAGLIDVLQSYSVLSFVTEELGNDSQGFSALQEKLRQKKIVSRFVVAGSQIKTADGAVLSIFGPNKDFLFLSSPGGKIGESGEFASLIIKLSYGSFSALLTSDTQAERLAEAVGEVREVGGVNILQVPHHGSKSGLTKDIVDRISPRLAVISVGKNNRYGHPSKEAIALLGEVGGVRVLRTDEDGEVEVVSDGKSWWVR